LWHYSYVKIQQPLWKINGLQAAIARLL
jgi:hypothetical protein